MEIRYYGANCVRLTTKKASIIVDGIVGQSAKKPLITDKDIALFTQTPSDPIAKALFVIDRPGEYEVSETTINGIATTKHYDTAQSSIMYSVHINGFSVAITGHTVAGLSDSQLEALGVVDILIIPVGGGGYTLDAIEAMQLIKSIEPKIVIPTHYQSKSIDYEVPQAPLDEFLKSFGASDVQPEDVLKLKDTFMPEKTRLVVLSEQ